MSNKDPKETTLLSDPHDPVTNSNIGIYFNKESKSIERITLDSGDGNEKTLFPMILESGEEYMPNNESYWDQTLKNDNETHSIFSLSLEEMENNLFLSVMGGISDWSFLHFTRYNLPLEDYARFIIEQKGVEQHLAEANHKGKITDEILNRDFGNFIMYWPEYYPGKENYNSEFLPTTEELYPVYLFNKLGYIFNKRAEYDLKVERFEFKELLRLKSFILYNYENEPTEIFNKIKDYHKVDSRGISHMMRYIEIWYELTMLEYNKGCYMDDLDNLPRWRR
jgi:hypothetical protein